MRKNDDKDVIIDAKIDEDGQFRFTAQDNMQQKIKGFFGQQTYQRLKMRFRAVRLALLATSFLLMYLAVTLLPFIAIYSFFHSYVGWWVVFALIAALIVAFIPLLGFMIGVFAAHTIWGWPWAVAILVFCWPMIIKFFVKRARFYFSAKYR